MPLTLWKKVIIEQEGIFFNQSMPYSIFFIIKLINEHNLFQNLKKRIERQLDEITSLRNIQIMIV